MRSGRFLNKEWIFRDFLKWTSISPEFPKGCSHQGRCKSHREHMKSLRLLDFTAGGAGTVGNKAKTRRELLYSPKRRRSYCPAAEVEGRARLKMSSQSYRLVLPHQTASPFHRTNGNPPASSQHLLLYYALLLGPWHAAGCESCKSYAMQSKNGCAVHRLYLSNRK